MFKTTVKIAGVLALSSIILTACGSKANNSVQSETNSAQQSTGSSKNSSQTSSSAASQTPDNQEFNIIGSFQASSNLSITFKANGAYTVLRDGKVTAGTFRIAAKYDHVILLKLTDFNPKTPGLDSYIYLTQNTDNSLNIGEFGTLTSIGTPKKMGNSLYLANYLEVAPETSGDKMVGTWTNKNQDNHVITTTNYNPDGTIERYSDASGIVSTGNFAVTTNNTEVNVTTTFGNNNPVQEKYTRNDSFTELTTNVPGISITYSKNSFPTAK